MAIGSQAANVDTMALLTGLTHDTFFGHVMNNVRRESPVAMLFKDAGPGDMKLEGQNATFAVDLRFKTGGMATDGHIPDYTGLDAVQGYITPVRRYARIALDNLVEKRASGQGAFDDISDRIFDKLWDAWSSMEMRHSIGPSSGLVCKCSSRTSSTVWVAKSGYGHALTNPIMHLAEGSVIAWYDVSAVGIGGAGKITNTGIAYITNTITMASASTWEPSAQLAADDLIYFATTTSSTADYFVSERNLAPNGLGTLLDPDAALTSVHNISETTYPRWKPYRVASGTFDHLELTEHWLQLAAKRGFKVSPATDVVVAFPSAVAQVARSLMGLQQQIYTGNELAGGYQMVRVSGISIVEDHFWYHDVAATIAKDKLFRVQLSGDADFWSGDGSMWNRIQDYDGKDAFVVDYPNYLCKHRGANGALTGIVTGDETDTAFEPCPNY